MLSTLLIENDGSLGVVEGAPYWSLALVRDLDALTRQQAPWPEILLGRTGKPKPTSSPLALTDVEALAAFAETILKGMPNYEFVSEGALLLLKIPDRREGGSIVVTPIRTTLPDHLRTVEFRQIAGALALARIDEAVRVQSTQGHSASLSQLLVGAGSLMLAAAGSLAARLMQERVAISRKHSSGGQQKHRASQRVKARVFDYYAKHKGSWTTKVQAADVIASLALEWADDEGWIIDGGEAEQHEKVRARVEHWLQTMPAS